jgi:hypothetical protein
LPALGGDDRVGAPWRRTLVGQLALGARDLLVEALALGLALALGGAEVELVGGQHADRATGIGTVTAGSAPSAPTRSGPSAR